jgi:hypothetical protein
LKKNKNDRGQYRYHHHHPEIVSESDFNAVDKLISNAKFGARSFMPELRVMSGGLLHGFVSVNPRWVLFSPDDYRAASESVGPAENASGPAITTPRLSLSRPGRPSRVRPFTTWSGRPASPRPQIWWL